MNLIDRYVYVATERLPENTRDDVSRELHANIEDMLPENATDQQIRAVLEKLGNPVKLGSEYGQTKRYLIGPDLYDSYLSVLKLVITIVTSVFACIALLEGFLEPSPLGITSQIAVQTFVNIIVASIQGAMQGAIWVTIIFVILERTGINEGKLPFIKKKWSPDDLLKLQIPNKRRISRGETIFSMVCTVLFTSILYFQPQIFGWHTNGTNGLTLVAPFFNLERLQTYITVFIIFVVISLCISIWKLISMEWNFPLAFANLLYNVSACVLVGVMINDNSLINPEFLSRFTNILNIANLDNAEFWLRSSIGVSFVVFIVISLWDSISALLKCRR